MRIRSNKEKNSDLPKNFNNLIFEKISSLFELKQKGAISTEDFIKQKKRLLGLF